ncbi:MAG: ATP-binding protein [Polyangiaceae bacterium]|nr:ATP-binding protein [Polyangiaceae bacterium]
MRTFTTDGPCESARHYLLPAAPRLAEAKCLVDQGAYFVLRSPGRTGKTTALRALAETLNAEGRHAALVCSAAVASPARSDLVLVQEALLSAIRIAAEQDLPSALRPPPFPASADATRLWEGLSAWARVCPLPIVLFFDDVDSLHGSALESVLRQLEAGFSRRPSHFPWSIGLSCQFDLHENAPRMPDDSTKIASAGPFERFWASPVLPPFTEDEIRALYSQHTVETQQVVDSGAVTFVRKASAGHPFFVQALGREAAEMVPCPGTITKSHMIAAFRRLVDQGVSSIDALESRLIESRVRRVIEPLLAGTAEIASASEDDVRFVRDIGLVAKDDPARIEGRIHRAIIPRLLAKCAKRAFTDDPSQFFLTDGRLAVEPLLHGFAVFYATHGNELLDAIAYQKVAPELVFLGFLYRMLEGRGTIDVDYGSSRRRIDVTLSVPAVKSSSDSNTENAEQREVFVLVSRRKGDSGLKTRGLVWLENALEDQSTESGTLVVFDRRDKHASVRRIELREATTIKGKTVRFLRA